MVSPVNLRDCLQVDSNMRGERRTSLRHHGLPSLDAEGLGEAYGAPRTADCAGAAAAVAEPLHVGALAVSCARKDGGMKRKELAHRQTDGLQVSLFWDPGDDSLAVLVVDGRLGVTLELPVRDESPLEVFYHPFAVASRRGAAIAA
jgi:hypothetical protein